MGSDTRRREALLALLLSAVPAVLAAGGAAPNKPLPAGCVNFGFTYHPAMKNVTDMPFKTLSSMQCQARCQTTPGCAYFAYFQTDQMCWLGGKEAVLQESASPGVVSGPAVCAEESPACSAIPGAGFPGKTPDESRAAWPGHEQPTNLQCWPRKENGFPATCGNKTAVVLEDTVTGWPGRCKGLMEVKLKPEETCQSRCFHSPLCGVWALENKTSGVPKCWQGLVGENCFDPSDGLEPMRAQLIMHGGFRVLMNTMNMKINNLTKIFDVTTFKDWQDGANACRKSCLSFLMCQYWQYSDVYGCFIEHAAAARVAWPLVNNGVAMQTGTAAAATVRAGEYVQHNCPKGPWTELPLDKTVPVVQPPLGLPPLALPDVVKGPAADLAESTGFPAWGILLTLVVVLLCAAVVGAAVWMSMADARKVSGVRSRGVAMPEEFSFQSAGASFESPYQQPQPAPFQSSPTYGGSSPTYAGAQGDSFTSQTPLTQNAMDPGAYAGQMYGGWAGDGYQHVPMQPMPQQPMQQWPQQYQDPRYGGGAPATANMQYPAAPLTPDGSYAGGYPHGYPPQGPPQGFQQGYPPQGTQGYPQGWSH